MRRMTIFRSKLLPTLAALVILSSVARAQDSTTAVPRDTTPAAAQSRTHVVQTGETLWSLAGQYLGDPLLWPAIYRRSEEHTSELQSRRDLVCRLLLEK